MYSDMNYALFTLISVELRSRDDCSLGDDDPSMFPLKSMDTELLKEMRLKLAKAGIKKANMHIKRSLTS